MPQVIRTDLRVGPVWRADRLMKLADELCDRDCARLHRAAIFALRTIGEALRTGKGAIVYEDDENVGSAAEVERRLGRLERFLQIDGLLGDKVPPPGHDRYLRLIGCPVCGGASRVPEYGGCDECGNIGLILSYVDKPAPPATSELTKRA